MSITYISHTADIRMLIKAKTLQILFKEALKGMGNILKESICNQPFYGDKKLTINVKASGTTNLLIDFLSDVLSHTYIEHMVFCSINTMTLRNDTISAQLSGSRVEVYDEEIKAVTYHEANVIKNKEGLWETIIIFDI